MSFLIRHFSLLPPSSESKITTQQITDRSGAVAAKATRRCDLCKVRHAGFFERLPEATQRVIGFFSVFSAPPPQARPGRASGRTTHSVPAQSKVSGRHYVVSPAASSAMPETKRGGPVLPSGNLHPASVALSPAPQLVRSEVQPEGDPKSMVVADTKQAPASKTMSQPKTSLSDEQLQAWQGELDKDLKSSSDFRTVTLKGAAGQDVEVSVENPLLRDFGGGHYHMGVSEVPLGDQDFLVWPDKNAALQEIFKALGHDPELMKAVSCVAHQSMFVSWSQLCYSPEFGPVRDATGRPCMIAPSGNAKRTNIHIQRYGDGALVTFHHAIRRANALNSEHSVQPLDPQTSWQDLHIGLHVKAGNPPQVQLIPQLTSLAFSFQTSSEFRND